MRTPSITDFLTLRKGQYRTETDQRSASIDKAIGKLLQNHGCRKDGEAAANDSGVPRDQPPSRKNGNKQACDGNSDRAVENGLAGCRGHGRSTVLLGELTARCERMQRNKKEQCSKQSERDQNGFGLHRTAST